MSLDRDEPADIDSAFAEIVAELETPHVPWHLVDPQPPAEESAEADVYLGDDEHFDPPEPPPFPRLHPRTVLAVCILAVSITLIVLGTAVGFAFSFSLSLGVIGVITSTVLLLARLRPTNDEGDDHAHV
ncbi:MAG TPA: hypothetical protein VGL26_07485 [Jatrophihabitans sp.]|jgi:hypothetical protein